MEEVGNDRAVKMVRGTALYLLSGATVFSLEMIVFVAKGWKQGFPWWLKYFVGVGGWLIIPYAAMCLLVTRRKYTIRQEIVHLFGCIGIVVFGITMTLDGFLIHPDPRNWVLYVLIPIYQWVAIAGCIALSYAVGKSLK
jgi:hypothetical protein